MSNYASDGGNQRVLSELEREHIVACKERHLISEGEEWDVLIQGKKNPDIFIWRVEQYQFRV